MKMKLAILIGLLIAAVLIIPVSAVSPFQVSGSHYQLNILGDKCVDKEVGDSNGHSLFVNLNGRTKIIMTQDDVNGFNIVDRNGCDGEAKFNLAPGTYNVYARAKGTPGGKVNITAYGEFEDALTGSILINLGFINIERNTGKPVSVNINKLFYVDVGPLCTETVLVDDELTCTEETTYTDYWVFAIEELLEYYWDYDNEGLKNLEVRFYECELDIDGRDNGLLDNYCRWENGDPIVSTKTVVAY